MAIDAGTAVGYLDLNTTKFKTGMSQALNDLKVFQQESATTSQKASAISGAMTSVGQTLSTHVTVPLLAVGAASVKVASDFEAEMSKVGAISGATGSDMQSLRDKAIEMGAKTSFSAGESAEAFQFMAQAGWKTSEMLDGIEGVMNLAAASGEGLGLTADIVTGSLTAFGLSAKDATHFSDVLAQAAAASNTDVAQMGETFKYVAPIAGALGFSVEDTSVAIGLMANSSIKGGQAGTALRAILSRLIDPPKEAADAIKQLGIEVTNTDGSVKPLDTIIGQLRTSFNGLTDSQKATFASQIGGQEAMSGLLAIVNASDEDFESLTNQINNSDGAAQRMAETMQDNLKGSVEQLKGSLESAAIIIGEKLTPYIRALADWIGGLVDKFNALSPETQDFIVKLGLIVAAIGPILNILGRFIKFVMNVGTSIKNLIKVFGMLKKGASLLKGGLIKLVTGGFTILKTIATALMAPLKALFALMLANPISIVIAVVVALVGGFIYLWNTSEGFRNFWIGLWEAIVKSCQEAVKWVIEKFNELSEFFTTTLPQAFDQTMQAISEWAYNLWESVKGAFRTGWEAIVNFFTETIPAWIESIFQWFMEIPYKVGFALGYALQTIAIWAQNVWTFLTETIPMWRDQVFQWFMEMASRIWEALVQAFNNVVQWGVDTYNNFIQTCTNVYNAVTEWFSQIATKIWEFLTTAFNNIMQWGIDTYNKFIETCTNIYNTVVEWFSQLPTRIWEYLTNTFNFVMEWSQQVRNSFFEMCTNVFNTVVEWFQQLPTKIWEYLTNAFNFMADWSQQVRSKFFEMCTNVFNTVVEWFQQLPTKIWEYLTNTFNFMVDWSQRVRNSFFEMCTNVYNTVVNWFSQLPTRIWEFLSNAFNNIANWGYNTYNNFIQTCSNIYNTVSNWFSQLPGMIWNYISQAYNNVRSWGSNVINSVASSMREMFNSVVNYLSGIPGQFSGWFGDVLNWLWGLPGQFWDIGSNMMSSLWDGLMSIGDSILGWVQNFADNVASFFNGIINGASDARSAASSGGYSNAIGIDYVPRDNYPINAHRGEMLLTQDEAEEYKRNGNNGKAGFSINISKMEIREENDIERVAKKLFKLVQRDKRGGRN